MLGEHGEGMHGLFIYEASLHVPLVMRVPEPDMRGRRVPGVVRTQDVLPTVVDFSLAPLMRGAAQDLNLDASSTSISGATV
jgi:arylsulfatase A-like enzyme